MHPAIENLLVTMEVRAKATKAVAKARRVLEQKEADFAAAQQLMGEANAKCRDNLAPGTYKIRRGLYLTRDYAGVIKISTKRPK